MNEHRVLTVKNIKYPLSLSPKQAHMLMQYRITVIERNRGISRDYDGHAYSLRNKIKCLCVNASYCGIYKEQGMDYSKGKAVPLQA